MWYLAVAPRPRTLVRSILASREASLFYYALMSLDDETRAWLATEPALIKEVVTRHAGAFVAAAPGLRVRAGAVRVPGGPPAEAGWEALVGRRVHDPADFTRALLSGNDGALAWYFGAMAQLSPGEIGLAFDLQSSDAEIRGAAVRRLYGVFQTPRLESGGARVLAASARSRAARERAPARRQRPAGAPGNAAVLDHRFRSRGPARRFQHERARQRGDDRFQQLVRTDFRCGRARAPLALQPRAVRSAASAPSHPGERARLGRRGASGGLIVRRWWPPSSAPASTTLPAMRLPHDGPRGFRPSGTRQRPCVRWQSSRVRWHS